MRVAPWMITNHLDTAELVFVARIDDNKVFRDRLRKLVSTAGCALVEQKIDHFDVWVQDCMEIGVSGHPKKAIPVVVQAPRDRELLVFPPTLLRADRGLHTVGTLSPGSTFDSSGNLEVTPPVTSREGKHFPFGRIYFGPGRASRELPFDLLDPELKAFLQAQIVQAPIEVDTGWLAVGHVDEFISFVPSKGTSTPFKLILASTRRAYEIVDLLAATNPTAKMFVGRTYPVRDPDTRASLGKVSIETTVADFVSAPGDFHPQVKVIAAFLNFDLGTLRDFNALAQLRIDHVRAVLEKELGLDAADIVELPVFFSPYPFAVEQAVALSGDLVNMLVVNGHCIIPDPFGPVVGAVDQFKKETEDKLRPLGVKVEFVDCWDEYHVGDGEIHCATNTQRKTEIRRWWEFQP